MANYIGVQCPVCEKKFIESDDIVVCPICGAPHHRKCYLQSGHCALENLHIKGHVWEPPEGSEAYEGNTDSSEKIKCPSCGVDNPRSGIFCQVCGAPLKHQSAAQGQQAPPPSGTSTFGHSGGQPFPPGSIPNAYTMAFGGVSPDEEIDGISARDFAIFIGANSHYYLPRFKQMSQGFSFSFQIWAFICNFFFFFYRKMYLVGIMLLALVAASQIPSLLIMPQWAAFFAENFTDILMGATTIPDFVLTDHQWVAAFAPILRYATMAMSIFLGMFANHIYFWHVKRMIRKSKAINEQSTGDFDDGKYTATLVKRGRTSFVSVVILMGIIFVAYCMVTSIYMGPYWEKITNTITGIASSAG